MMMRYSSSSCRRFLVQQTTTTRRHGGTTSAWRAMSSSSSSSAAATPRSSFSPTQMETDRRYQGRLPVPESLLTTNDDDDSNATTSSEFSIRGAFRPGRAAYLDMSATTPLDPRVLAIIVIVLVGFRGECTTHSRNGCSKCRETCVCWSVCEVSE